jgi:hypothetical protein
VGKRKVREVEEGDNELARLGIKLHDAGFNVVPVDNNKKPLTSWAYNKRIERGRLEELLGRASGIAIVGGPENPLRPFHLVLIDVDRPDALERCPALRELVGKTVSWYTGPRCPKCEGKDLDVLERGRRFRCRGCGTEFNAEEAKRGLGLLVGVGSEAVERYLGGTVRGGDVEFLVRNYQLIPPSAHPSGVRYEWVRPPDFRSPNYGIYALTDAELETLLGGLGVLRGPAEAGAEAEGRPGAVGGGLRELSDGDILKVKDLLEDAYRPGVRQYIWLFLSGWGAKAGVSPVSIAKILKMLYEESGDTDPIRTRASAIVYSYKKAGVDLTPYAAEFEAVLGVKPYGLEREIREEEVKGRTGLQEILEEMLGEEVLGEERALEVIKELSEVFQVASPFRDSIIEILDYERQLYAVANLRKLVVVRARRSENRLVYKEKVVIGAPTKVVVYINPIGGITKYQVRWEAPTRPKPIVIGPCLLEEIVSRLRREALVVNSRLVEDVVVAVIEGFIRRGRAEIKTEIESPGFYYIDGKLVTVGYEVEEPSQEELRRALELLDRIATEWFGKVLDRFATVVKWWILAPFGYAVKQVEGGFLPGLFQYGPPNTRKSTLNRIGQSLWGFRYLEVADREYEIPGSSADNPARLEYWINRGTFPICIKEPAAIFENQATVEMIKSAIEGLIARGKYRGGGYITTPALASLSFTSNTYLPSDPSLIGKRLVVVKYSYAEALNPEREEDRVLMDRFEREILPRLGELQPIGGYVASRISKNPELLKRAVWIGNSWLDVAEELLEEAYKSVGLEPPAWLRGRSVVESITEVYEDKRELIREFLVRKVNEEYSRFVGRVLVEKPERIEAVDRAEADMRMRLEVVLDKQLIPWLLRKGGKVYITRGIVNELERAVGNIGDLKSLAELLGWGYDRKSIKLGGRVVNNYFVIVDLEELVEFLSPDLGAEDADSEPGTEGTGY